MSSSSSIDQYITDVVVNGSFAGNATGWALSGGATYLNNSIRIPFSGSATKSVSQNISVIQGRLYLVSFDVIPDASKSIQPTVQFCGSTYVFDAVSSATTCKIVLRASGTGLIKVFLTTGPASLENAGYLDNVKAREITEESSSSLSSVSSRSSSSLSSQTSSQSSQSSSTVNQSTSVSESSSSESTGSSSVSSLSSSSFSSSSSISSSSVSSVSSQSSSSLSSSSLVLRTSSSSSSSLLDRSTSSLSSVSSQSSSSLSSSSGSSSSSNSSLSTLSSLSSRSSGSSLSTAVKSSLSSSGSSSSTSSQSSSLSSVSSIIIKSSSSLSSSSTVGQLSSLSSSFSSSSSSDSSGENGWLNVPWSINGLVDKGVLGFALVNQMVYAATAQNKVLQSSDGVNWVAFSHNNQLQDDRVSALFGWANGLFIGTESRGRIYVKNFTSGSFYHFVQTADHAVKSFAEFNGKMYVGTAPMGFVYSFDGVVWKQEFQAYGGINAMVSDGSSLYLFLSNAETGIVHDGLTWETMPIKVVEPPEDLVKKGSVAFYGAKQNHTISSWRSLTTEPSVDGKFVDRARLGSVPLSVSNGDLRSEDAGLFLPTKPERNVSAAVVTEGGIMFGGENGVVCCYSNEEIVRVLDAGSPITAMLPLAGGLLVAATNKLFLI